MLVFQFLLLDLVFRILVDTARRSRSRRLWLSLSELVDRDAINCRQIQAE